MDLGQPVVQAVYGLSSASAVPIGYIVWQHREKAGTIPLLGSIVAAWWWSTAMFLATLVADYTLSVWLTKSIYLGVGGVVTAVFCFALEYTGREHLVNRTTVGLLSIHPIVVTAVALVNPRNLFHSSVGPDPASATGVASTFGPAFWAHTLYSYALLVVATVLIVGMLYRSRALYRGQILALLAALAAPTAGNLVGLAGLVSFDPTPVGFVVANALFAVAITRYQLIDLSPIARDRVLDEISDAVFVVDVEGRLIDVNEAGEQIAGLVLGRSDIVGEAVEELLSPLPSADEAFRDLVAERSATEIELPVQGRHFSVRATPLDDGRGRHAGWLFLVRDVTDRKEREAELRHRNEQLDQFASVVSHDLRNPLGIAKGYVDLVEETGEVELLGEVEEAHRRMEVIIEDVLALAREGSVVTEAAPVDLRGVAEDAWGNVDTDGAALRVADDATVDADRDRLLRLLENLFRNALEHGGPDGPAADEVAAEAAAADGAHAITVTVGPCDGGFYVEDDGEGIPEASREQVFESGYSGGDGTGFGLPIVQQIAEVHGWRVSVTDGTDGGARFEFDGVTRPDRR